MHIQGLYGFLCLFIVFGLMFIVMDVQSEKIGLMASEFRNDLKSYLNVDKQRVRRQLDDIPPNMPLPPTGF